ncbi:hypothetical protein [Sphingomonas daechungensis]|uniref:hypothetical protein n=1 Tax=Sphingomonas daechungensis TaxID=1176646 RepID=UPI0037835CCD
MTGNDEDISMKTIEVVRDFMRKAAARCCEHHGFSIEDVAVASIYSTFDIAQRFKSDPFGALEWLRTALDLMERQLMEGSRT